MTSLKFVNKEKRTYQIENFAIASEYIVNINDIERLGKIPEPFQGNVNWSGTEVNDCNIRCAWDCNKTKGIEIRLIRNARLDWNCTDLVISRVCEDIGKEARDLWKLVFSHSSDTWRGYEKWKYCKRKEEIDFIS